MELSQAEWANSEDYLSAFDALIGDERTRRTFHGVLQGIIAGESLRAAVIARFSPYHGGCCQWRAKGETHGRR